MPPTSEKTHAITQERNFFSSALSAQEDSRKWLKSGLMVKTANNHSACPGQLRTVVSSQQAADR